jgi:hypothetical protein
VSILVDPPAIAKNVAIEVRPRQAWISYLQANQQVVLPG